MKKVAWALALVSLIGVAISGYALYLHYKPSDSFCNLNETFNCDVVNTGQYSTLFDIPVAIFGLFGYLVVGAGGILALRYKKLSLLVVLASIVGFIFALYLTGIEAFVIETYCVVCLASQATIFVVVILSILLHMKIKKDGGQATFLFTNQKKDEQRTS